MSFSERFGLKSAKSGIQLTEMDEALRTGLWNVLTTHYFQDHVSADMYSYGPRSLYPDDELKSVLKRLWLDYFKRPLDTMESTWDEMYPILRTYFFESAWNEVYDFCEFVCGCFPDQRTNSAFWSDCNFVLQRERSAYRFVNGRLARVTDKTEIDALEAALALPRSLSAVSLHLTTALDRLSDRKAPDYRNSIKESISAVEAMCALITRQERSDLNAALRELEKRAALHGALKSAFNSLYGFTSDSNGIRHALLEEPNLTHEDAMFMLVTCSAFVNYLKMLAGKTGVSI